MLVLLVLTSVICLFYYEVIFLGRTIVPVQFQGVMGANGAYEFTGNVRHDYYRADLGAFAWAGEPWTRKVSVEYAAGRFPLWNEHQGFGSPLLANGQSGGLDLMRLPVLVSGSALAWDVYYLARVFLGGLAAYLFARTVGLVLPARLFLAIAYIFSGHFLILGNNIWVTAYLLLPAILLGTELIIVGRQRLGFIMTAVTVALVTLVGMPAAAFFVLLFCVGYGGYRLVMLACEERRTWVPCALYLAGAWLVGMALAAPLLLPFFEFVAQSSQVATGRTRLGLSYEPLGNFTAWFIPLLNPNAGANINSYIGSVVLLLALYSLYPARTRLYRQLVPFTMLVVVLLMAKTFGVPVINELGRLPVLGVSLIQKWSAPVTGFGLALLASVGLHRLLAEQVRLRLATAVLLLFGCLLVLAVWLNGDAIAALPPAQIVTVLSIVIAVAVTIWWIMRFYPHRPAAGPICCGFLVLELATYAPHNIYQDRYDRFAEPPFVGFLRSQGANENFRIFATDGLLYPNSSTVFALSDIRSLDALYTDRYLAYIQNFISSRVTDRFVGDPKTSSSDLAEGEPILRDNPWFDLTGVRYVITSADPTAMGARRLVAATGAPAAQYTRVYNAEVQIFENRWVLPRAFLVSKVIPVAGMQAAIATMTPGAIEPDKTAVVEGPPPEQVAALGSGGGTATIRRYSSTHATIDVQAGGSSFLVLTDSYYPGWRATIDGHDVNIYAADLAFRGTFVPAGEHRVEFSYEPVSFRWGLAVAALGAVVLAFMAVGGVLLGSAGRGLAGRLEHNK